MPISDIDYMNLKKTLLFTTLAGMLAVPAAYADTIYTFTASGTAASDGRDENASAIFSFNDALTQLTITLENTGGAGQVGGITSMISNLEFDLTGDGNLALTLASAPQKVDCTASTNQQSNCTYTNLSPDANAYGWTIEESPANSFVLAAGAGSFKPYSIANTNITGNTDGTRNGEHNPYLIGPVVYTFSLSGFAATPGVTNLFFSFGTVPDFQPGTCTTPGGCDNPGGDQPVPEPTSLALLGIGLASLAWRRRRS